MATLVAVDSVELQASITLWADLLVPLLFLSELVEGSLGDAMLQVKYQVQVGSGSVQYY